MSNESPFSRLGEKSDTARIRRGKVALYGRETLFSIAARNLGEWRRWREVAEENLVQSPWDVAGLKAFGLDVVFSMPRTDIDGNSDVSVSDRHGQGPDVYDVPGSAPREIVLWVREKNESGDHRYELTVEGSDGTEGAVVVLRRSDFCDVNGDEISRIVSLRSPDGIGIVLSLTQNGLFCLWFAQKNPIRFRVTKERDSLLTPPLALPTGRGE